MLPVHRAVPAAAAKSVGLGMPFTVQRIMESTRCTEQLVVNLTHPKDDVPVEHSSVRFGILLE